MRRRALAMSPQHSCLRGVVLTTIGFAGRVLGVHVCEPDSPRFPQVPPFMADSVTIVTSSDVARRARDAMMGPGHLCPRLAPLDSAGRSGGFLCRCQWSPELTGGSRARCARRSPSHALRLPPDGAAR